MYRLSQRFSMDTFLVSMDGDDADTSGKPEEVMDAEDGELSQEVSSRTILHWNYRGLTALPTQLLR